MRAWVILGAVWWMTGCAMHSVCVPDPALVKATTDDDGTTWFKVSEKMEIGGSCSPDEKTEACPQGFITKLQENPLPVYSECLVAAGADHDDSQDMQVQTPDTIAPIEPANAGATAHVGPDVLGEDPSSPGDPGSLEMNELNSVTTEPEQDVAMPEDPPAGDP